MSKAEKILPQLRRSRRISQKTKDYDEDNWSSLDSIATYCSPTKRDRLTGRGLVHCIEDVTAIEFETLEDMKLYDSVAEKRGNICCASFDEFSIPFRGFSEEEFNSSYNYHLRFKALKDGVFDHLRPVVAPEHTCVDNEDGDISYVVSGNKTIQNSMKNSKSKFRRVKFGGSSTCRAHGKRSCAPCSAAAMSPKLSEISPDTSSSILAVPSRDAASDVNIENDLLLTPVGSPASSSGKLNCPAKTLPSCDPWDSNPIDLPTIPYVFRCSAPHECLSSNACANLSSNFTLCLKLTLEKGRVMSRFAVEYLDKFKDTNTVDRISATIAASAVDSSASTILLPLNKELISCSFSQSKLIQSLASLVGHTHFKTVHNGTPEPLTNIDNDSDELSEWLDIEKSPRATVETPEAFEMLIDPKHKEILKSKEQKPYKNLSKIVPLTPKKCVISSDACSSAVSPHSSDKGELYNLPVGKRRRATDPNVTPRPLKKSLIEKCSNTNYESHEISKNNSEPVTCVKSNRRDTPDLQQGNNVVIIEDDESISDSESLHEMITHNVEESDDPLSLDYQKKCNPGIILDPSSPKSSCFGRSKSVEVVDSLLSERIPNFKLLRPTRPMRELLQNEQREIAKSAAYDPIVERFPSTSDVDGMGFLMDSVVDSTFVGPQGTDLQLHNSNHVTASQLNLSSVSKNKQPPNEGLSAQTVESFENTIDSEPGSSDKIHPQIVSTAILATHDGSYARHVEQLECKKRGIPSQYCSQPSNVGTTVYTEKSCSNLESLIDLTAGEDNSLLCHPNTVKWYGRLEKRKRLSSSCPQQPEKVIVIDDDDLHETENQVELDRKTSESGTFICGSSSKHNSPVTFPASHVPKGSPTLNSNEKITDLTECSGYGKAQHNRQSVLAAKHPAPSLKQISNSKESVIDLTDGDEEQTPVEKSVGQKQVSAKLDYVSNKNDVSGRRRKMSTKMVEPPSHDEVTKNKSYDTSALWHFQRLGKNNGANPSDSLQELAVMCTDAPALGYVKVIRSSTGEIMLNETFTARVYKHFEDLKALNTYLNQRFEKMPGVKNRGCLNWILATAGVIKLKKVPPVSPKVWFHPTDYILTEDGPDNVLTVVPLNEPKTKSCPSKSQANPRYSPKPVPVTPIETGNILLSNPKFLPEDDRPSPAGEGKPAKQTNFQIDSDKPRTARFVSFLLDKQSCPQQGPISSGNKLISFKRKANSDQPDVIWLNAKLAQNNKQSYLLKNEVSQPCDQMSTDFRSSAQNKPITTHHMAVLLDKHPNNTEKMICTTNQAPNLVKNAIQSTNQVPSSIVQNNQTPCTSATSQNQTLIACEANQLTKHPATSAPQAAVIIDSNPKYSLANQTVRKSNGGKPTTPQILFSLTPVNSQPDFKGKVYWKTIGKSNTGQPVVLIHNKQFIRGSNNQENPINLHNSSPSQAGSVVNSQAKDTVLSSHQSELGTSQNLGLLPNCQTSQANKVYRYEVPPCTFSTLNTPGSAVLLPNEELGQSTSQSSSNSGNTVLEKPTNNQPLRILLNSQTRQAGIMAHQHKVPTGNTLSTPTTPQSVALLPNAEHGQSTSLRPSNIPVRPIVSQPVEVLANNQNHESKGNTLRPTLPNPASKVILLNCQTRQPIKAANVLKTPTSAHSLALVPDKQSSQSTYCKSGTTRPLTIIINNPTGQARQISLSNAQSVIHNKPTTSQKAAFVPNSQVRHPIKIIPVMSTNAQGTSASKLAVAQSVTQGKQPPNIVLPVVKTAYPDAMIYFSSEEKNMKGVSVRKFPSVVNKTTLESMVTPQQPALITHPAPAVSETSSTCSNIVSAPNKPVEFIRKSSLPKVLLSKLDKKQDNIRPASLKLHWTALNMHKPSQP